MRWQKTMRNGAVAVGLAATLAACGTGSNNNGSGYGTSGNSGNSGTSSGSTVSSHDVAGVGTALTGADGKTLYFADQETDGQIKCMDACLSFWTPVTVPRGVTPKASTGVTGTLATLNRPDGGTQVTYDGKPLYAFAEDHGPGQAKGNGFKDSFNGTAFTWHAAALSGAAPASTPTPDNGGGYGNGY
jgi:predicted lipoprotein with Yx(FWY)xxD motif